MRDTDTTAAPTRAGDAWLDRALERIDGGEVELGLERLYEGLLRTRDALDAAAWEAHVEDTILPHPVRERIHRDPIARRSFEKPRGYAGDAVLLDYIYGLLRPAPGDPLAEAIYAFGKTRPASLGVCRRRLLLAERIDEVAARAGRPVRVLSVAAGHLREAEASRAFRSGQVEELVALDADAESCAHVARALPGVTVVEAPFTALYRDRRLTPRFDLVYSAGLYDYLEDKVAAKLSARLFDLLAPGGTLLLTNFLTSCVDAAYMESFMAWRLLLRSPRQVAAFAERVPPERVAARELYMDSRRAIGYLELTRL